MMNFTKKLSGKRIWNFYAVLLTILISACMPLGGLFPEPVETKEKLNLQPSLANSIDPFAITPQANQALLFSYRTGSDALHLEAVDLSTGKPVNENKSIRDWQGSPICSVTGSHPDRGNSEKQRLPGYLPAYFPTAYFRGNCKNHTAWHSLLQ